MPIVEKSLHLERESVSPGVVFEPLKGCRQGFLYGTFQWCEGNESEVVVRFTTHRIMIKGKHLDPLPDYFAWQQVRRVKVLGRAEGMLSNAGDSPVPIVTDIQIEPVEEQ
jgi:hypothetical protein